MTNMLKKVFNWLQVHLSEMNCYKIHILVLKPTSMHSSISKNMQILMKLCHIQVKSELMFVYQINIDVPQPRTTIQRDLNSLEFFLNIVCFDNLFIHEIDQASLAVPSCLLYSAVFFFWHFLKRFVGSMATQSLPN